MESRDEFTFDWTSLYVYTWLDLLEDFVLISLTQFLVPLLLAPDHSW